MIKCFFWKALRKIIFSAIFFELWSNRWPITKITEHDHFKSGIWLSHRRITAFKEKNTRKYAKWNWFFFLSAYLAFIEVWFKVKENIVIACVRCYLFPNKNFKDILFLWNSNLSFEETWNHWYIFYMIQICTLDDKVHLKQDGILLPLSRIPVPFSFFLLLHFEYEENLFDLIIFLVEIKNHIIFILSI